MAGNVTLATLRQLSRFYSDERGVSDPTNDGFVNTTELDLLINLELRALYDRLVAAGGHDYYESTASFTTVSGTAEYNLASMTPTASTFYRLRRVQIEWGTRNFEEVDDFKMGEELDLQNLGTWGQWGAKAVRVVGSKVRIRPTPTSAATVRIYYVPAFTDLTSASGSNTFDGVNGWHDAVALGVAVKVLDMQNLQSQSLQARRDEVIARIDSMAAERAADQPKRVLDVRPEAHYTGRGRTWGLPRP
jgi:hypothetical protein